MDNAINWMQSISNVYRSSDDHGWGISGNIHAIEDVCFCLLTSGKACC